MGIVDCVNGSGWLHRFTHRHVLSQHVKQGEMVDISAKVAGGGGELLLRRLIYLLRNSVSKFFELNGDDKNIMQLAVALNYNYFVN
jgi:hypothetical protein